jgi:uncharacterized BrkB/YihY/UPF0761 family membrane protein
MPVDPNGDAGGAERDPSATEPESAEPPAPKPSLRERSRELRTRADATKRSLETRAEDLRTRHTSLQIAFAAYERDRRQAGGLLAGGLAFRIFLWLLPTALALVSGVRLVAEISSESPEEVADHAGLGAALAATVAQGAEASGRGAVWLLILGIALMVWAGIGMVKALRLLSSVAWQIRPTPLTHAIRASLIFSGVALVLMSTSVLLGPLYASGIVGDLVASVIMVAVIAAILTWAMGTLPHPEDVTWLGLLPGAVLMAVGAEIVRIVSAVYFAPRLGRTSDLYGALGLAAVFLAWLYLIGRLAVGGFALNAEVRRRHRQASAAGSADPG